MWVVQSCSAERADLMSYFDTEQTPTTPTSSFSWIEDAASSSWSTVSSSNKYYEVISAQRCLTRRVRFDAILRAPPPLPGSARKAPPLPSRSGASSVSPGRVETNQWTGGNR